MTVLNIGRFAGSGVGNVLECHAVFVACKSQDSPKQSRVWTRVRVELSATAWPVYIPRFVLLNHSAESFCRRQALVNVDHGGHVAYAERRAAVCLFVRDADRPCHSLRVVRHGITQAIFAAADAQVVLQISLLSREGERLPRRVASQNALTHSRLIPEFATGGIVQGTDRGFDSVRALLRPGEMVLTQAQQSAIAMRAGSDVFRQAGFPGVQHSGRFAEGGIAPSVSQGGDIIIEQLELAHGMSQSGAGEIFVAGGSG
jgi:hypothetical protein